MVSVLMLILIKIMLLFFLQHLCMNAVIAFFFFFPENHCIGSVRFPWEVSDQVSIPGQLFAQAKALVFSVPTDVES